MDVINQVTDSSATNLKQINTKKTTFRNIPVKLLKYNTKTNKNSSV